MTPPLRLPGKWPLRRASNALRGRIGKGLGEALPAREAGLARALALGDWHGVSEEDQSAFRRSGTAHLLAVSGLHVSMVGGIIYWLLTVILFRTAIARRFRVASASAVGAIVACWAYAFMAGLAPPAMRAAAMATVALSAVAIGKPAQVGRALCIAAAALVVVDPSVPYGASFQLSFAAVLVLSRFATRRQGGELSGRARRALSLVAHAGVASTAAALGTAPLVAHHFGELSVVGPLVNVVAVPAMASLTLPATLSLAFLAASCPEVAAFLGPVVRPSLTLFLWAMEEVASIPWAAFPVPRPTLLESLLATAGVFLALRARPKSVAAATSFLLVAVALFALRGCTPQLTHTLRATFLDVGQGDATLLELPAGQRLLVDSGPSHGEPNRPPTVVAALERRGFGRLHALVLTHRHEDHVAGARAVLTRVGAGERWGPLGPMVFEGLREPPLLSPAELCRPRWIGPVELEVLHPCDSQAASLSENDRSLVLRVTFGRVSILLPGDLEGAGERVLLQGSRGRLEASVLKVPHHGSNTSSSEAFIAAVQPRLAIASCGRSASRPLPHPAAAARIRRAGALLLSTAESGAIEVTTDGVGLHARALRGGRVPVVLRPTP